MIMLATVSEDGVLFQFFDSHEALLADLDELEQSRPTQFLTPAQASGDPNYWPERSAFVAEVVPLTLEPEQVITRYRLATQ